MSHRILQGHVGELRQLLNDWDILGVGDISAHDDEYDCLLGPLLARLVAGGGVDDVRALLGRRVEDHFGFDPEEVDVAGFADKVIAWWITATTTDSSR